MIQKEIDVSVPFDTIIKTYPDGSIFLKKLKFTGYKVKAGWERITDEERLAERYDRRTKQKDTYASEVQRYKDEKDKRWLELQGGVVETSDTEDNQNPIIESESVSNEEGSTSDDEKRRKKILYNIAKTRNKIFDIARSNDFNYFITLTFNAEKCDRYSFSECSKKVRKFMNHFKDRHKDDCPDFKYLLVHEQHKDGAYHYHGLVYIQNKDLLTYDKVRSKQYANTHHGKTFDIYNWSNWRNGFSTVSEISDQEACRKYILKYISKNSDEDYQKGQRHFYYSQNCLKPTVESVVTDNQMLYLYDQIYDTDRSTGYESTVEKINEYTNAIMDFRYGIDGSVLDD